jgi:uncharacterized membrane protein
VYWARCFFSVFLLAGFSLGMYRELLFSSPGLIPWGSDTLGHVLKAEYLKHAMQNGIYYPNLLPGWYMGLQMLRYHPPLPYYVLVFISWFSGDMILAAGWFVVLCAFLGGLFLFLFQRWLGWFPAILAGILFLFLPDNVRVALAEGNLPRVLASALFPLAVYFLLRLLEAPSRVRFVVGLALTFTLILLSHAMMAAIYAVCCGFMILLAWVLRSVNRQSGLLGLVVIALGILLGAAWLLPSLVGGLTGLDASAVTEALTIIPPQQYFNPFARSNPEIIYIGAILLALALASLFWPRKQDGVSLGLIVTALLGVAITLPGLNDLYNSLPVHGLMWPLRFLGAASFFMLLGLFWQARKLEFRWQWPVLALFLLLALDGSGSLKLIHLRPVRQDMLVASQVLAGSVGWREATLDDSRLSSEPSYFLTAVGGREQLFGWAYQGARTASNVAALNEAVHFGHTAYLVDRLALYGVDDILLLNNLDGAGANIPVLKQAGFTEQYLGQEVTLLHRDGFARAVQADWKVLGIGRGAQNLAYVFPQVILGSSTRVDDYSLEFLSRFDVIFLSGFRWNDMAAAEKLLVDLATQGKQVLVDLTGTPEDPLAKIPHFLGVWGEPVMLPYQPVQLGAVQVGPFGASDELWHALVPQGAQADVLTFDYLGQKATALGYTDYGSGRVWFLGLNLVYYCALHPGTAADDILAGLIDLTAGQPNVYQSIPLTDYAASSDGYSFSYTLDQPHFALMPFAAHDGYGVMLDGAPLAASSLENLISVDLPSGRHTVRINFSPTRINFLGWSGSILAALLLAGLLFWIRRAPLAAFPERSLTK